jgi:hypothetical protein
VEDKSNSLLNTSGSSLSEEIYNAALSNLDFISDEEQNDQELPFNPRKNSATYCDNID